MGGAGSGNGDRTGASPPGDANQSISTLLTTYGCSRCSRPARMCLPRRGREGQGHCGKKMPIPQMPTRHTHPIDPGPLWEQRANDGYDLSNPLPRSSWPFCLRCKPTYALNGPVKREFEELR